MKRRNEEIEDEASDVDVEESDYSEEEDEVDAPEKVDHASKKQKHNAPSAEEVQVARETAQLFKSNIFKMQIDELLSEINVSEKKSKSVDKCLFEINDAIKSIEGSRAYTIKAAKKQFPKTQLFCDPQPSSEAHYNVQYVKPKSVNVVGSYALKTVVKQPEGLSVDLVVEMPSSLFDKKDNVNYRYFHKRSFYIHYLKQQLSAKLKKQNQSHFALESMEMTHLNGNTLLPIITMTFSKPQNLHINIIPATTASVSKEDSEGLAAHRLGPEKNSVRFGVDQKDKPTPLYNSLILSDMASASLHKFLVQTAQSCPSFREACKLGRLWLRQRGFGSSYAKGGMGHLQWAVLMAALLNDKSHSLMNGYSSYQLFKGTLSYVASHGLNVVFSFTGKAPSASSLSSFQKVFPAVIAETDLNLNVAYNVSQWSIDMLRHEAAISCEMLLDVVKDRFASIFLTKFDPKLRFDCVYSIKVHQGQVHPAAGPSSVPELESEVVSDLVLAGGDRMRFVNEKLFRVISRALESRSIQIWMEPETADAANESNTDTREFKVGLLLSADAFDVITKGPNAENEENAQRFRRFWGTKAELRRFADGSIVESVVWSSASAPGSDTVIREIVSYITALHLPGSKVHNLHKTVSPALLSRMIIDKDDFFAKYNAFEVVSKDISRLELPIAVKGVHATSPSLRMTSTTKPEPYDIHGDDAIGEGVIEFETSFRWPAAIEAVEQTKIAFLVKIAESLPKIDEAYTAQVGTETYNNVQRGFIVVRGKDGFSFKLRIRTERDLQLLERERRLSNDKSLIDGSILLYDRTLSDSATAHNRLIRSMALRYHAYAPACRLFKFWLKSHLLLDQQSLISDQAAELISLVPFLDSTPYAVPQTAVTALVRIIVYLASWNWKVEPLILDPSEDASRLNELAAISLNVNVTGTSMSQRLYRVATDAFNKLRTSDPMLTLSPLFIATPADLSGILWTRSNSRSAANSLICSRMTGLAIAARKHADSMFVSSLDDYDFVIKIRNPLAKPADSVVYKNLQSSSHLTASQIAQKSPDMGQLLYHDLVEDYKDCLVLFYRGDNKHEEGIIAGVWSRGVQEPRAFRVNLTYSTEPAGKDSTVKFNKPAVLEEIIRRAGDLVADVTVNRK